MLRRILIVTISCLLVCVLAPARQGLAGARATSNPGDQGTRRSSSVPGKFVPGQILVKFRAGVAAAHSAAALDDLGLSVLRAIGEQGTRLVSVPAGEELKQVAALKANPLVEFAEVNGYCYALGTPNDPQYDDQWAWDVINAPAAWDFSTGSSSVIVAVLDTGVDLNHPDLAAKIVPGHDFVNDDDRAADDNGHGTHLAGTIGAVTNNGIGVAGMSWGARIMPVKVLDSTTGGNWADIAAGVGWATAHGAKIIDLSLGSEFFSSTLQTEINAAHAAGVLVVAAAGNCGDPATYNLWGCSVLNPLIYPAAMDNVMSAAATDSTDARAAFSEHNAYVDVAAPGVSILSTLWNDTYDWLGGTSMAAPHVAGLAALVWSVAPSLTNDQVQQVIQDSAVDLGDPGRDDYFGYGRIDALAALQMAAEMEPFLPASLWYPGFKFFGPQNRYPRLVADMNGDGLDDAVAFDPGAGRGTFVSLSAGSAFAKPAQWSTDFNWLGDAYNHREVGDADGDGKADVVGFLYGDGVYVGTSTGASLAPAAEWLDGLKAWGPQNRYPRWLGDVDGDGKADVVAVNPGNGVYVGLSSGSAFAKPGESQWTSEFAWLGDNTQHRAVGDVDGDGKDDLVGYVAGDGVYVGLSSGTAFAAASEWLDGAQPWGPQGTYPWMLGDVNGDGKEDIIAYQTDSHIWYALSTGASFEAPVPCSVDLAWLDDDPKNVLQVGNVDGANGVDLVAFKYGTGIYVALSNPLP